MPLTCEITCLCGLNAQTIDIIQPEDGANKISLELCHCDSCRFSSGQLCTSYYPIAEPAIGDNLRAYRTNDGMLRYFCRVCGCHIFRETSRRTDQMEMTRWGVATGTVKGPHGQTDLPATRYTQHTSVSNTRDGGVTAWLPNVHGEVMKHHEMRGDASSGPSAPAPAQAPLDDRLQAACACGTVQFFITRPNQASSEAQSSYPDLMYAYETTPAEFLTNSGQEKWWIGGTGQKYTAGTCACRSCRLFSGFEIQFWAFIPWKNIFLQLGDAAESSECLDFSKIPSGILQSYQSSPGVTREFCGKCGSTVFWHCDWRPDLIDVSVGLLRAPEGARAESWLQWWRGRVSFEEDAELDRHGSAAQTARDLIVSLASGLKAWDQKK